MTAPVAFVIHQSSEKAKKCAEKMASWFHDAGVTVFYPQKCATLLQCQMVVTFGGDGTLLAGAEYALQYDCPLMGINLGTTGFLTEGDPDQLEGMFHAIMNHNYAIEKRGLLQIAINDENDDCMALNDAVVTRGGFARLIQVQTIINGELWGTFIADGVIAATPTGSTGYSLSAGGPVVAPGVECMIVTPVCAHSLQHSPCVVPRNAEIVFRLKEERDHQAQLQIDGRNVRMLRAGDFVRVTGAKRMLKLARVHDYHFFQVLKTKLSEWSSTRKDETQ